MGAAPITSTSDFPLPLGAVPRAVRDRTFRSMASANARAFVVGARDGLDRLPPIEPHGHADCARCAAQLAAIRRALMNALEQLGPRADVF